ncbi:MAG TPA: PAN domain-containing protein [Polyangiaceae bacterium]|nr:PAN domain-containing protein [Polyangiaceae bacterium]
MRKIKRYWGLRLRAGASILLGLAATAAGCSGEGVGPYGDSESLGTSSSPLIKGIATSARPEVGIVNGNSAGFCTGTLISQRFFITAAHCIGGNAREASAGNTFTIGSNSYPIVDVYGLDGHPQTVEPGPNGLSIYDIAIGRLATPVPTSVATPATIADREPSNGEWVTDIAYGCTESEGHGNKHYRSFQWPFSDGTLLCGGDSGGPLFLGDLAGQPGELIGINSGTPAFIVFPARVKSRIEALVRSLDGGEQAPLQTGINRSGGDLPGSPVSTASASTCRQACAERPDCRSFTFTSPSSCSLKANVPSGSSSSSSTSGVLWRGLEIGWDRPGPAFAAPITANAEACRDVCSRNTQCRAFSWVASNSACYMKTFVPRAVPVANVTSGISMSQAQFDLPSGTNLGAALSGKTPDTCEQACASNAACKAYTVSLSTQSCQLKSSAGPVDGPLGCTNCVSGIKKPLEMDIDRNGGDIAVQFSVPSAEVCQQRCIADNNCRAFTYATDWQVCYLKGAMMAPVARTGFISGLRGGIETNVDRSGHGDYSVFDLRDCTSQNCDPLIPQNAPEECQARCEQDSNCKEWTLIGTMNGSESDAVEPINRCFLNSTIPHRNVRRGGTIDTSRDRIGGDLPSMPISASSATSCQTKCLNRADCRSFTFSAPSTCWLKSRTPSPQSSTASSGLILDANGVYSGRKGTFTF